MTEGVDPREGGGTGRCCVSIVWLTGVAVQSGLRAMRWRKNA
jgi:hypothetical protein